MKKPSNNKQETENKLLEESLSSGGSLDTVRDILFGAQIRESNTNAKRMEDHFGDKIDDFRKDTDKQLKDIRDDIAKLKAEITKYNETTAESLSNQFSDTHSVIDSLEARTQTAQSDMHDQVSASQDALEAQTKGWIEDLAKQLDLAHSQLMNRKADRELVATLLSNMANGLLSEGNDSNAAAKKDKNAK